MPQKLRCEVSDVVDHGGRVYSVLLKPERPAPRFSPGQFLHLALEPYRPGDFWPDSRVFSIAGSPTERDNLRITYAVKGAFTARMEAELAAGRVVWVKLPYGEFTVARDTDVCLIAGGTGITAFTAFLSGLPAGNRQQIDLFYGARQPGLLVYRPMVQEAEARCPGLHAHFLAEQNPDGAGCLPGRLDMGTIGPLTRDPQTVIYYLSGPPAMLTTLQQELADRGVEPGHVRMDAWE
jgi:ferredoxin-NADP reductase